MENMDESDLVLYGDSAGNVLMDNSGGGFQQSHENGIEVMEGGDAAVGVGGGESFSTSNRNNVLLELYILCEKANPFDDTDKENVDCWEEVREWLRNHTTAQAREAAMMTGENNVTPLYLALRNGAPKDIIEVLTGVAPRTVQIANTNGWLPMHIACHYGASLEVLRILAEFYPESTRCVDQRGRTPLHFALGNIQRPISPAAVLLLLTGGAGKCADMGGMLPLHYACAFGASEAVLNVLLEGHHETIAMRDNRGRTPLHIAMGNCNRDASPAIVKTLLQKNPAVINMVESENRYLPLHMLATASEALGAPGVERVNAQACLDHYLNAKPDTSAEFFTTFQKLPDWLIDHAVQSPIVQQILNNKIAQRFPTFIQITDVYSLILIIISYVISVHHSIKYRANRDFLSVMGGPIPSINVEARYTFGLYIGGCWFALRELLQIISYTCLGIFSNWLRDPMNWVDVTQITVILFVATVCTTGAIDNTVDFRRIVAVFLVMPILKLVLFLRSMNVDFSVFSSGMWSVLVNLWVFTVTIFIILVMFTSIFYSLFFESDYCKSFDFNAPDSDTNDYEAYCVNFWYSFLYTYTMFLGEVNNKPFYQNGTVSILIFSIFMVLVVVLLANVLIAIVTDYYSWVRNERSSIVFWRDRLDFIAEMDALSNFIFSVTGRWGNMPQQDNPNDGSPHMSRKRSSRGGLYDTNLDWLSSHWKDMMLVFEDQRASNPDLSLFSIEFLCCTLLRLFALIVIPCWIALGAITFGLLWPEQVRQRLFSRISDKIKVGGQMDERFQQIRALRNEMKLWQDNVEKEMASDRKNVMMIKNNVMELQSDVMRQMKDIKQIMTMLLELQSALESE